MKGIRTSTLNSVKTTILVSTTLCHNFGAVPRLYSDFTNHNIASNPINIAVHMSVEVTMMKTQAVVAAE